MFPRKGCAAGAAALCLAAVSLTGCTDPTDSGTPPPGTADSHRIPLTVVERAGQTIVLVPVTIEGEGPFTFLLDTGASSSAVDDDVARDLDLPGTGERRPISGVVGTDRVPVVEMRDWAAGEVPLDDVEASVVDLPEGRGVQRVQGLLGSDALSGLGRITIDYDNEVLLAPR
ncbi:aspartyl protease family protein [Streptomyces sp. NPDC018693]|uniref:aspartyl protease family protein n=1 Tax=unclassified Streptomyces TaxID=2593676 RepID=UPI0037B9B7B8